MNTIYMHEESGISVTLLVGNAPYAVVTFFVFSAFGSTWVFTPDELRSFGVPAAFIDYCKAHMSADERGEMAVAIAGHING